ncbi:low temperature requirement protein A [Plantactinospora endophytica]|uniref:Membrane protein n=1 Tax=Plantactinospora endophytica TaxID=673535 RepID=A0ABQ4DXG4_9ACTN|nr:low temperature requirement protein A [Plantactinospora endophytica]GIG87145.1 membrane protein [Plantactinospora endophytica]
MRRDKGVTWEELFFDLAFVFAVIQLSALLRRNHDWLGTTQVLILFVSIYWTWVGTTVYANQRDIGNARDRVGIFALGLGNLVLALAIPGAYGDRGLLFGCAYLTIRFLLAGLALQNLHQWRAFFLGPFGVGSIVAGPLLLAGGLTSGTTRTVLWAIASLLDVSSPWILRRHLGRVRLLPLHYTHRYGLLLILVLGESVLEVGAVASTERLTAARLFAIGASYAFACALWWAYFVYGMWAFRRAIARAENQGDVRRSILLYGHLLFSSGVIAAAVGLAEVVSAPDQPLLPSDAALLCGGAALFLITFAYTHWRIHRQVAWRRLGAGLLCLLMLPLAMLTPGLAALIVLTLVIIAVSLVEQLILRRQGRGEFSGVGPDEQLETGGGRLGEADRRGEGDEWDTGPVVSD